MRPDHLFVSSADGALYDTRRPNWSRNAPLRPHYRATSREICSTSDLRATLRAGPFAWPGGYTLAFVMGDGDTLCFDCARAEYRQLSEAIRQKARNGWRPLAVACEADSDEECACAHCSKTIWGAKEDE